MGKKADKIKRLEDHNEELMLELLACRRAHSILSRAIKKALQLKNWPDFHQLYGSGLFAEGVARLLNEEIDKLRENQK